MAKFFSLDFVKDLYRFFSFVPLFFLLCYFFIVATDGRCCGTGNFFIPAFIVGLVFACCYPLPFWLFSSTYVLFREPLVKKHWIYFLIFIVPAILLFVLLKYVAFDFFKDCE
jgi:hypothetical protein